MHGVLSCMHVSDSLRERVKESGKEGWIPTGIAITIQDTAPSVLAHMHWTSKDTWNLSNISGQGIYPGKKIPGEGE